MNSSPRRCQTRTPMAAAMHAAARRLIVRHAAKGTSETQANVLRSERSEAAHIDKRLGPITRFTSGRPRVLAWQRIARLDDHAEATRLRRRAMPSNIDKTPATAMITQARCAENVDGSLTSGKPNAAKVNSSSGISRRSNLVNVQ